MATLSADTTPTINLVVAECLGLVDQTEDYLSGSPHFESFGTNLVRELKKRLAGSVFNLRQAAPNAEPLYLIAALLDPYTAPALDDATFGAHPMHSYCPNNRPSLRCRKGGIGAAPQEQVPAQVQGG